MKRELFPGEKHSNVTNETLKTKKFSRQKPKKKSTGTLSTSSLNTTTDSTNKRRNNNKSRSMSNNSSSPTSPIHSFATPLSQFELEREARIAKNVQRMKEMGLENLIGKHSSMFPPVATPTPRKVRREDFFAFVSSFCLFLSFFLSVSVSLFAFTDGCVISSLIIRTTTKLYTEAKAERVYTGKRTPTNVSSRAKDQLRRRSVHFVGTGGRGRASQEEGATKSAAVAKKRDESVQTKRVFRRRSRVRFGERHDLSLVSSKDGGNARGVYRVRVPKRSGEAGAVLRDVFEKQARGGYRFGRREWVLGVPEMSQIVRRRVR